MGAKQTRWDVALETLDQVLNSLPDDFNVGLRIYGHRELSTSPKTCSDSELVIPVRKLDRKAILARVNLFKPKGETPLVYSALQVPGDLKALGGGTVILIIDGGESCKGDPVMAGARELVAPRIRIAVGAVATLRIAIKNGQLVLE
jgi:Ca-activated chloride channel family protein